LSRTARICWALTAVYWLGLFIITHIPAPRLPYVPVTDKTAHFVSYALLAIALSISLTLSGRSNVAVIVLALLLLYGAIDEWLQIPVNRSCELADWYADAAGAAAGVVIARLILGAKFG
jgi:VanZ family protein